MAILALTETAKVQQVHHIYLWQIVVVGSAVALAALLVVIVLVANFRRAKDNTKE